MKAKFPLIVLSFAALIFFFAAPAGAQDWVHAGTNLGNARIRLGAADFKPVGVDPQTPALKATFDATLYGDLQNAGIFDLVSKSMAPQGTPGAPQEINLGQWSTAPANAEMVAFGALRSDNGRLIVYGWLDDTRNTQSPQVLAQQYNEAASQDMARTIAHRFADAIIERLGGGINGIAETKIYFVSNRTGTKEIWAMDYDGQNQHQASHPTIAELRSLPLEMAAGQFGCIRWTLDDWSASREDPQVATINPQPGRPMDRKSLSHPGVPETRRYGLPTRAVEICISSRASADPTSRPPGTREPTRKSRG
jgi:hypothetical protein